MKGEREGEEKTASDPQRGARALVLFGEARGASHFPDEDTEVWEAKDLSKVTQN